MTQTDNRKHADDIVVTGIGTVTPIGGNREIFFKNLIAGVSGAAPIAAFEPEGFKTTIACEISDFNPLEFTDKNTAKRMSRFSQFAVCAALEAAKDADLQMDKMDTSRIGCVVGSAAGGYDALDTQYDTFNRRGPCKASPMGVPKIIPNMASGNVSIALGIHGPGMAVLSACATGLHSIAVAMQTIKLGEADVMVAGGTESTITPLVVDAYSCMRVLSQRNDDPKGASRPFDKTRDGFVIGEGAGILVLEKRAHAEKRGVPIYATLGGVGMTTDAHGIFAPEETGTWAAKAMEIAISQAGLTPTDIGYINAHGTSTGMNDKVESRAILSLFGEKGKQIPVSSNKSMIGHTLGAAGAIEAAATILSMKQGVLPPTINQEVPDPDCPLDTIPNIARETKVEAAITNSFGFGGQNASLAIIGE
jgi:3-oxoacyl-[acyl-carrier-protein] synthase II